MQVRALERYIPLKEIVFLRYCFFLLIFYSKSEMGMCVLSSISERGFN